MTWKVEPGIETRGGGFSSSGSSFDKCPTYVKCGSKSCFIYFKD